MLSYLTILMSSGLIPRSSTIEDLCYFLMSVFCDLSYFSESTHSDELPA
jgi:hypothetical protein